MIKIENLTMSYQKNSPVIQDISFEINRGECVLFTGESGSGKSSIINAINGLAHRYDGANIVGDIFVQGKKMNEQEGYEIAKMISNVFQNPKTYFFNVNTTLELLFYLENLGLSREEMEKRIKNMLEIFPIEHLLNRDIFQLSGGEKQILCVASCYIAGTGIILFDEPSSNLDEKYIEVLEHMLMCLKKKGITLVLSEHRLFYLMDLVDKVWLIQNGKMDREYTQEEFKKISEDERVLLGLRSIEKPKLTVPEVCGTGELVIKSLEFYFEKQGSKLKMEELSFQLGKIYGIIGHNGCGKSTFVRSVIGVEKKSKEEIYFCGKKLSKRERIRCSSLVMQDVNHQIFTDEVEKELLLGTNIGKEKAYDYLKKLNLYEWKNKHPFSLSGGQKQRVAIASALCKGAKFLFFDEPTSGMDFRNMQKISRLLKEISNKENIMFIISHDVEFLNDTVDYIINMEHYKKQ